ncbi:hypothetical protein DL93DRAFT_2071325 [Clavulina sp. PMI_390]|nr:hypothetical protein DL93DRAFT_2071325 [Clavulina sp. PMI_390]
MDYSASHATAATSSSSALVMVSEPKRFSVPSTAYTSPDEKSDPMEEHSFNIEPVSAIKPGDMGIECTLPFFGCGYIEMIEAYGGTNGSICHPSLASIKPQTRYLSRPHSFRPSRYNHTLCVLPADIPPLYLASVDLALSWLPTTQLFRLLGVRGRGLTLQPIGHLAELQKGGRCWKSLLLIPAAAYTIIVLAWGAMMYKLDLAGGLAQAAAAFYEQLSVVQRNRTVNKITAATISHGGLWLTSLEGAFLLGIVVAMICHVRK